MREHTGVVLVSNRGPVSFVQDDDGFTLKRGAGGLAGALDPVARRLGEHAVWIAAATSKTDREALTAGAADDLASELGYAVHMLDLDPEIYSGYYDVVSNRMLWFALHCLWKELDIGAFGTEELAAWRHAYEPVNERFARAVVELTDPTASVLFQDYHLTTAPRYLREARPEQAIFHFTHSSFCGPRGLDPLPEPIPRSVVEGMLGADLLGFHVASWVEGFLASCESIGAKADRGAGLVEHDGRRTWVRPYPIPIDSRELQERARGDAAQRWAKRFTETTAEALVVRADRAEPSKNIVRGFEAFGLLLDRRPDLQNGVVFIACLYPSRQSMPEYRRYAEHIESTVDRVNERHPGSIQLFMQDDYDRTLGALTIYDVLLVNSIMDGMNLVSKEGPTVNRRSGAVVLSRGTGSFDELGRYAVEIGDPLDIGSTATAIERALEIPTDERRRLSSELRAIAQERTPEDWIQAQLEDLHAVSDGEEPHTRASG